MAPSGGGFVLRPLGQIEHEEMNTRLYVGNLSFHTTADGVRTAFQEFGTVSDVHLVSDRETGRSRGFAFVEMPNEAEAKTAIEAMNNAELSGRPLKVVEARPREDRPYQGKPQFRSGGGGGGGGAGAGGGGGYRDKGKGWNRDRGGKGGGKGDGFGEADEWQ